MERVYLFDADNGVAYVTEASSLLELFQKFVSYDTQGCSEKDIEEILGQVKTEQAAEDWFCDHSMAVIYETEVCQF